MWNITSSEIRSFQGSGGTPFTKLINSIIRAHAFVHSLPVSNIHTNLRTNLPDGGVDTTVQIGIDHDPVGWMDNKTVWQYKGTESRNVNLVSLREEISKDFVKRCIRDGYGYRFCICDSVAFETKQGWLSELNRLTREISGEAAPAKILDAEDLAVWANKFPSIILQFFRPSFVGKALHMEVWRDNALATTSTYVPVPNWEPIRASLKAHVDFAQTPVEAVIEVQGNAGVGKTRMVYEFLAGLQADNLIIYVSDDQHASEIATELANDRSAFAILVADECSLESRYRLEERVRGHKKRVRIIAIDNAGERSASAAPVYWLETMSEEIVIKILAENFPEVVTERRSAYANLAGGFVRLAADMCAHDQEIRVSGGNAFIPRNTVDYYRLRLKDTGQRTIVDALSLFKKIGFAGEVADEFRKLCEFLDLSPTELLPVAKRLHDAPGFVGIAGRYLYVTPQIIAQIAFSEAWQRWAANSPEEFLKGIPAELIDSFVGRVKECGREPVRRLVGDFFWQWAVNLKIADLSEPESTKRLIAITETDPAKYLQVLRKLTEGASPDDLLQTSGKGLDGWGPRRHIVWMLEGLARFPEYFDDVEAILLQLAIAESEPTIGNNATSIWKQLFRIALSGTAIPFTRRLQKLRERFYSTKQIISDFAIDALDEILEHRGIRMVGSPIVAGKIPPTEWNPKTLGEQNKYYQEAVAFLEEAALEQNHPSHSKVIDVIVQNIRQLIRTGYLERLQRIFNRCSIPDETRVKIITGVEEAIDYDLRDKDVKSESFITYTNEVSEWLKTLRAKDIHGRVVDTIGIDPWYHSMRKDEEDWLNEISNLAAQFIETPDLLKQEVIWLCSPHARSAGQFGFQLGKQDCQGKLLDIIVQAALQSNSSSLASGYVSGILQTAEYDSDQLNEVIDRIENSNPRLAFDIAAVAGDPLKIFERALRLVDQKKLPLESLGYFSMGINRRPLSKYEFAEIIKRFLSAQENHSSWRIAVNFIEFRIHREREASQNWSIFETEILRLIWPIVERPPDLVADNDAYHWGKILESFVTIDSEKVAAIATKTLLNDAFHLRERAELVLVKMAPRYPTLVMRELGKVMLDNDKGWRFQVDVYRGLINAIPHPIVSEWIQANGMEAARRIARHLPVPHLDLNGQPVVEPLTEFVLSKFGEDERVFSAFCAGIHSLQLYSGDIAAEHEREAAIARKFRDHPLEAIRKWAIAEEASSLWQAKQMRERNEEWRIE